jgi:hypothetical protein
MRVAAPAEGAAAFRPLKKDAPRKGALALEHANGPRAASGTTEVAPRYKARKKRNVVGFASARNGLNYIAATKLGNATEALPSRSCVIRAAIPVYIEAARKALKRTLSLAWLTAF